MPLHPQLPLVGAVPPHVSPDRRAKVTVQTPDRDWAVAIGRAIQSAVHAAQWSNKEAAGHVDVDDAEFGKWINGTRRPHLDRLFAVEQLRVPLIIALAQLGGPGVETSTVITIKKVA